MNAARTHRSFPAISQVCRLLALLWLVCPAWAAPGLAPDWTLTRGDGSPLHFRDDARGRHAVLFFWTTWCPHCARALPHLEALHREFAPRGVRFYALDIWEDGDAVAYFHAHGYHLPLFLAADLVAEDYGIEGTPGIVVVDPAGRRVDLALDGLPRPAWRTRCAPISRNGRRPRRSKLRLRRRPAARTELEKQA